MIWNSVLEKNDDTHDYNNDIKFVIDQTKTKIGLLYQYAYADGFVRDLRIWRNKSKFLNIIYDDGEIIMIDPNSI